MPVPDLSRLTPADAAVTFRSLDRRFRAAARPLDDPDVEIWAEVPGPDGHSAADHVAMAGRTLTLHRNALHQITTRDEPFLDEAVLDPGHRGWRAPSAQIDVELDALGHVAAALADEVEALAPGVWGRRARAPGRSDVDAAEVLAEAVRSALVHLDGADAAMTAARRD